MARSPASGVRYDTGHRKAPLPERRAARGGHRRSVPALEALVNPGNEDLVMPGANAGAAVEPGMEPEPAHPARRIAMPPASCSGASR